MPVRARSATRVLAIKLALMLSLALSLMLTSVAAQAQTQERLHLEVNAPSGFTPVSVIVHGVLADRALGDLLRNGFPVRVQVRAELWRSGGWFDVLAGHAEWNIIIRFDTFDGTYEVVRIVGTRVSTLGTYKALADAKAAAELPYAPPLPPPVVGRQNYIAAQADVSTMEMSDLDEVQRWLRGEAQPAVQGRKNPGTALTRGLKSLVTRLLGAEVRHIEGKSPHFIP